MDFFLHLINPSKFGPFCFYCKAFALKDYKVLFFTSRNWLQGMFRNFFDSKKKQREKKAVCNSFYAIFWLTRNVKLYHFKGIWSQDMIFGQCPLSVFFVLMFQSDGVCNLIDQNPSRKLHIDSRGMLQNYRQIVCSVRWFSSFGPFPLHAS